MVAALSRIQRAEGEQSAARRSFTVARTEAVLKLRDLPRPGPWSFTLSLLRAASLGGPGGRASAAERVEEASRVVTLTFVAPGLDLAGLDLRGLVLAAAGGEAQTPGERWRGLVGAALNAALADAPASAEVRTSAAALQYVRKDSHAVGQDPYGEHRASGRCPEGAFEVELRWPRPSFGRRLTAWLSRQASAEDALTELWRAALFGADSSHSAATGIELGRPLPGQALRLGEVATWGAAPLGGPWLVREGVRVLSLAPALARAGLPAEEFAGWIDCPVLRPTADETSVAHDAALELLVAWLLDARDDRARVEAAATALAPRFVKNVAGRAVEVAAVAERCRQGRDLLYVWPHQAAQIPAALHARVLSLWPSELANLLRAIPEARAVPALALGQSPQFDRADLSKLVQASLPAVPLDLEAEARFTTAAGVSGRIDLQAHVHRFASADEGAIILLAHERRVGHVREPARVLPGVTLIASLIGEPQEALSIDALRDEKALLHALAERCRGAAQRQVGRLLAQALTHTSPWELPLVRAEAATLNGAALAVRYRARRDDDEPSLGWEESPLLSLSVGHATAGPVTLQDALVRCRDVGGIVVEAPKQRWTTFTSADPRHEPWALAPAGRRLVEQVLGEAVLWDMPTLAEGHLLPAAAERQRHLILAPAAIHDALAARRWPELRASLLVASALGEPAEELACAPLFVRFDPRALDPLRLVSLADAQAERLGVLPAGSASRALAAPVLLATPGEAHLLQSAGLAPAAPASVRDAPARTSRAPRRRAGAGDAALAVLPVADPLALGALRVEARTAKIAVWGGGLHIDDLTLPAPLDWIGGRLSLSKQGVRAGSERLGAQVRAYARAAAERALLERLLHPPGSPQREGLDAFRGRLAADPQVAEILREETGPSAPPLTALCAASLARHPPRRLLSGPRRFEGLLRQVLARPLVVGSALLSWQVARLIDADGRGWSIELGRRSDEVQRILADDAPLGELFAVAALALGELFPAARARGLTGAALPDELVASYRLLALLYAHVP